MILHSRSRTLVHAQELLPPALQALVSSLGMIPVTVLLLSLFSLSSFPRTSLRLYYEANGHFSFDSTARSVPRGKIPRERAACAGTYSVRIAPTQHYRCRHMTAKAGKGLRSVFIGTGTVTYECNRGEGEGVKVKV